MSSSFTTSSLNMTSWEGGGGTEKMRPREHRGPGEGNRAPGIREQECHLLVFPHADSQAGRREQTHAQSQVKQSLFWRADSLYKAMTYRLLR